MGEMRLVSGFDEEEEEKRLAIDFRHDMQESENVVPLYVRMV